MKKFLPTVFVIFTILFGTLAEATVYTENFNNVPGWENGWLGQNSNLTNTYGVGGGRGNNPDGLWIGESTINFAAPFGATITKFSIDTTTWVNATFQAYDMNNSLIYSSPITVLQGAWSNPGTYQTMLFNSTDGVSKIVFQGSNIVGNTSIDNVTVTAVPEPEEYAMMLLGFGMVGHQIKRKQRKAAPAIA